MIDKIKIIVGLGNPGGKYALTYHNAGQQFLTFLSDNKSFSPTHTLFDTQEVKINDAGKTVWLIQPTTFMNDSGKAVKAALKHFHVSPSSLLIIHDDSDIPLGHFRISKNRGSAGHHGIDSVMTEIKTKDFSRIRIGIGTPDKKAGELALKPLNNKDSEILQGVFREIKEKVIEKT
jgi:PTH1 family peptidyl-tRNA hydrolase